jgi:hypothetical protein
MGTGKKAYIRIKYKVLEMWIDRMEMWIDRMEMWIDRMEMTK